MILYYLNSNTEIIINHSDIDDIFGSICITITSNKQKFLGRGSSWIIDSAIYHIINITKYNPLTGSNYIST